MQGRHHWHATVSDMGCMANKSKRLHLARRGPQNCKRLEAYDRMRVQILLTQFRKVAF